MKTGMPMRRSFASVAMVRQSKARSGAAGAGRVVAEDGSGGGAHFDSRFIMK
jgi:hypothetical protein